MLYFVRVASGQQSVTNSDTATLVLVAYVVVVLFRSEYVFTESGSSTCRRLIAIARTIIGSDVLRDERFLMPTVVARDFIVFLDFCPAFGDINHSRLR